MLSVLIYTLSDLDFLRPPYEYKRPFAQQVMFGFFFFRCLRRQEHSNFSSVFQARRRVSYGIQEKLQLCEIVANLSSAIVGMNALACRFLPRMAISLKKLPSGG